MQENASIILLLLSSYHIDTSTCSKNHNQTLLQEIDMAMMDNSSQESPRKNSIIRGLQISSIPFIRNDWDWKVNKNNLSFDMTHYLTGHNLGYDHEDAAKSTLI